MNRPLSALFIPCLALLSFIPVAVALAGDSASAGRSSSHNKSEESAPLAIAGLQLGANIEKYRDYIQPNFLQETVVTDWHGFRKGVISTGVCRYSDQVLKIDMKYGDRSRKFFDTLLEKFKQQFGEPDGWHGDSFGVLIMWKWHFTDADNNPVSLSLQFNGKDSNETLGSMVKLSYPQKIAEERQCITEMCDHTMKNVARHEQAELKKSGWSYFIPTSQGEIEE